VVVSAPTLVLLGVGAAAAGAAAATLAARRRRHAVLDAASDRDRLAAELSRRLGELYSLQELTHVLSSSLQLDHVVAAVARYAKRFLEGAGAAVVLAPEDGTTLRVVAAEGSLLPHLGQQVELDRGGLLLDALAHERVELRGGPGATALRLFGDVEAHTAAVAPLKAHGVTLGAVVVADKSAGGFVIEDARLLSTVATHAAVTLAHAQLFDLVRRGKEQWEATFDALFEGMALVDDDGKIRRANSAFADLVGQTVTGVVGQQLCHTLFGEHRSLADLLAAARAGRRPPPIVRRAEPLKRVVRVAVAPVARAVDGASIVAVVEDITEQQALEAQLIQSEKMAAVGTLVSGVAHELNNPLTSIAGLSEFLLEQPPAAAVDHSHLRVINEQAERASRIVRDLLTFGHKGPTERSLVDLGDVVEHTVPLVGYELRRRGISLETSIAKGLPAVLGDRYQLQQVVLNLLNNAAHALSGIPEDRPRHIAVTVADEPPSVVLRVADTGPGVSDEVRSQMFSPFFTTKAPGEGTGLGLFVSYGIAQAHGGTLAAQSRERRHGEGAVLVLTLPAATPQPLGVPPRPRRILVVDHDPAVRRVVEALFAREGYAVDGAADGAAGLRMAGAAPYDLVIADHLAAAGREPLAAALARLPGDLSRRLLLSTSDARPVGDERGGPRLLKKPFDLRELLRAAEEVLGRPATAPR
jgi:two-component system NtrC family sensor kinase